MILLDANLLLYAINRDLPQHEKARAWLESELAKDHQEAQSWHGVYGVNPENYVLGRVK